VRGDWYRDPWDWKELDWVVPGHLEEHAIPRLNASGVKRAAFLDVAKENFAVRPAVVLDPLDRLIYQGLVDCVSVRLIGELPRWAYGWRLPRMSPHAGGYSPNDEEWEAFRDHLGRLASYDSAALTTDVVSFFGSIPLDPLCEQILDRVSNEPARRLVDMVGSWYQTTGRGLPQRSAASAVLAHMYLEPLDAIVGHYSAVPPGGINLLPEGRALRWMDDVWIFGRSLAALREAQIRIQAGMRDLGLAMNFGKTRVLTGDELLEAVLEIEHSAVDSGLNEDTPDLQPLDDLIDRVLSAPVPTPNVWISALGRSAPTRVRLVLLAGIDTPVGTREQGSSALRRARILLPSSTATCASTPTSTFVCGPRQPRSRLDLKPSSRTRSSSSRSSTQYCSLRCNPMTRRT
jgi:hypothetical protein